MQQHYSDFSDVEQRFDLLREASDGSITRVATFDAILSSNLEVQNITSTVSEQLAHYKVIPQGFLGDIRVGDYLLAPTTGTLTSIPAGAYEIEGLGTEARTQQIIFARTPLRPSQIIVWEGNHQIGVATKPLNQAIRVRIVDQAGIGVEGISVTATVNVGSLKRLVQTTDREGYVTYEYTCGADDTAVVFTLSADGLVDVSVSLTVENIAPTMTILAGSSQTGRTDEVLPNELQVILTDQEGAPIRNAIVAFSVISGTAKILSPEVVTDAEGIAGTEVRLGSAAGAVSIRASYLSVRQDFNLNTVDRTPTTILIYGGDNQVGNVGETLGTIILRLLDQEGASLPDYTLRVILSDGTVDDANFVTDARGIVYLRWTLGENEGQQTCRVIAGDVERTVTATAEAVAYSLRKIGGDSQSGVVGYAAKNPLIVQLLDGDGKPVNNELISFSIDAGDGELSRTEALTNSLGIATVNYTFGETATAVRVVAALSVDSSFSTTFNFSPRAVVPRLLNIFGGGQVVDLNDAASPLRVRLVNQLGDGIAGEVINFEVTTEPTGGDPSIHLSALTDSNGYAQTPFIGEGDASNGTGAGTFVITARYGTLSTAFSIEVRWTSERELTIYGSYTQSLTGTTRSPVSETVTYAVRVTDNGLPVSGLTVTWGGAASGTSTTDASGIARRDATIARSTAGVQNFSVTATVGDLSVTFTTTVTITTSTFSVAVSGTYVQALTGTTGNPVSQSVTYSAKVTDENGSAVVGAVVTWGGAASGTSTTNASGVASRSVTVSRSTVGTSTFRSTATYAGASASFTTTVTISASTYSVAVHGAYTTSLSGTTLSPVDTTVTYAVKVTDESGSVVIGATVTWGGHASGTSDTNSSGVATMDVTIARSTSGTQNFVSTATYSGASASFTTSVTITSVSVSLSRVAPSGSTVRLTVPYSSNLDTTFTVSLTGDGEALSGESVSFRFYTDSGTEFTSVVGGHGFLSGGSVQVPITVTTNSQGQASATFRFSRGGGAATYYRRIRAIYGSQTIEWRLQVSSGSL